MPDIVPDTFNGARVFWRGTAPEVLRRTVTVHSRPGVNHSVIVRSGWHGRQFTARMALDAKSMSQAVSTWDNLHRVRPGREIYPITWGGVNYAEHSVQFLLVDVRLIALRPLAAGGVVGGLNPPSRAWLEVDLDLVPIWMAGDEQLPEMSPG